MNLEKKDIAVIGESQFTLGFRLAGVNEVHDLENFQETVEDLIERDDLGIVIARQEDLDRLPERTRRDAESSVDPVLVPLSEQAESERLQEKIKKAIGADIT
ncbi:MAG: V-type ATP synthase subunit F [Candidatus Nanohaloarchaea archaeon]